MNAQSMAILPAFVVICYHVITLTGTELMPLFFCAAEAMGWEMMGQNNVGERRGKLFLQPNLNS